MKKTAIIFLLLSLGIILLFSSCYTLSPSTGIKYERLLIQRRVAVLEIANKTKYGARRLSDSAQDILVTELVRSRNFICIEREKMDLILQEQSIQFSDITEHKTYAKVGQLLNCEYLIIGSISNFGVKEEGKDLLITQTKVQKVDVEVDLKVIEVNTGVIVYAAYGRGYAEHKVKNILGLGESSSYDESLAGDALRNGLSLAVVDIIDYFMME